MATQTPCTVIVVAGGRSTRFGSDKLDTLLGPTLDGLPADCSVVCVGPARPTARAVRWVREEPAFAGPLAAVAAGLVASDSAVVVLVGGDMTGVGAAAPALRAIATAGRPAALVDASGRRQPLASAWPRAELEGRLAAIGETVGRPLSLLLDVDGLVEVADLWGAARDLDQAPPAVRLEPMDAAGYEAYADTVKLAYATELAEATDRPLAEVLPEAGDELRRLLPSGAATPGHHVTHVVDVAEGGRVGVLWVGPSRQEPTQAWVFDVELDESARGRGLGRAAMLAAEDLARADGYASVGLNVFGPNRRARALYDSLGYRTVRTQMSKELGTVTGPSAEGGAR